MTASIPAGAIGRVLRKAGSGLPGVAVGALAGKVAGALLSLAVGVVVARVFGPSAAGHLFLATALVTWMAVAARGGMDGVLLRDVAAWRRRGEDVVAYRYYRQVVTRVAGVSLLVMALLALVAPALASRGFDDEAMVSWLYAGAPVVVVLAVQALHVACLKACDRPVSAQWMESVLLPACLLCGVLLAAGSGLPVASCWATAAVASAVFTFGITLPRIRALGRDLPSASIDWHAGTRFLSIALLNQAMTWWPLLVLGIVSSAAEVAAFGAAARIAMPVSMVLVSVNAGLSARLAAAWSTDDRSAVDALYRDARRWSAMAGCLVAAGLAFFAGPLMLLYGEEFAGAAPVLRILLLAQVLGTLAGPLGQLLAMTGHERWLRRAYVFAALVTLLAAWPAATAFGATGVAWVVVAASATLVVLARAGARRAGLGA